MYTKAHVVDVLLNGPWPVGSETALAPQALRILRRFEKSEIVENYRDSSGTLNWCLRGYPLGVSDAERINLPAWIRDARITHL